MSNKNIVNAVLCTLSAILSFIFAFRYKRWLYLPIGICEIIMAMLHIENSKPKMIDVEIDD